MLAIVIPYFKRAFFEATLDSLANQTNQRFKVYIGDDASPESPVNLLEKYKGKFDFDYHRFEINLGVTSLTQQWERCIALCGNEEWIMILGDDDVLGENVVANFYNNLPKIVSNKIDVVRFSTQKINDVGTVISEIYLHPTIENSVDFLFRKTRSSLSEYLFKKEKVIEIGFKDFSLGWYADVLAVMEFSEFGSVYTINNAIINVRVSNESISGNQDNSPLKIKANFDFYNLICIKYFDKFNSAQKVLLLTSLNKCYLDDKKKIKLLLQVSVIYFKKGLFRPYLNFLLQILKYSLKI